MTAVYLIRHGRTKGNMERRYAGSTDEPLCEEGMQDLCVLRDLLSRIFPKKLYVSPMQRCRQTAALLFPGVEQKIVDDFREMDFGEFEYKNYAELAGDARYQAFIDSGGVTDFPGAEPQQQFRKRVRDAFVRCMMKIEASMTKPETDLSQEPFAFAVKPHQVMSGEPVVFVVHGGTIMAILEAYAQPHRAYFDWQTAPAGGYRCEYVHTETGLRLENVTRID